jgi:hypothetical protein
LPKAPGWVKVIEGLAQKARSGKFKSRRHAEEAFHQAEVDFRKADHLPNLAERRIEK